MGKIVLTEGNRYMPKIGYADTLVSIDGFIYTRDLSTLVGYDKPNKYSRILSTVKTIGSMVFDECKDIEYVEIPNSVLLVFARAFVRCERLKMVSISDSVKYLSEGVFAGCYGLETLKLPIRYRPVIDTLIYENTYQSIENDALMVANIVYY